MITATVRATLVMALSLSVPMAAQAQGQLQTPPSPPAAPATPAGQPLSEGQLDALLAPIALYPDTLLSEILMASTYPLEVVEAGRWADANKNLKQDALMAAVQQQPWDDSVKSLIATPDVLDMMSQKLSWTQQLGDAVLAQQPDVMDAIQRLRAKAQANDKLVSNQQQTVTTEQQNDKQVIVIESAQPDTVYVPYYNPSVVYGSWPYPSYPPYYWPAPGYIAGGILATGLAFGAGYALGRWASGGYWGGSVNWSNNNININRNTNINNINRGGNNWVHNPAHRQGVRYNNPSVANRFGGNANIGGAQNRMDFRGRSGNQVLQPGVGAANRANIGGGNTPNLGGGGNRPNGGGGNTPNLGGGGNRPNGGGGGGAKRSNVGGGGANRPNTGGGANGPGGGGARGQGALGNITSGRAANIQSNRGHASLGGGGGIARGGGGGGGIARGGGGGGRGGGGGGGGGRGGGGGGGRRSDLRLKHDVALLGRLNDGLGYYRFVYNGGHTAYVGVIAQEVRAVMPEAVARGPDGYLRVFYDKLGLKFQTYDAWLTAGARIPTVTPAYAGKSRLP